MIVHLHLDVCICLCVYAEIDLDRHDICGNCPVFKVYIVNIE